MGWFCERLHNLHEIVTSRVLRTCHNRKMADESTKQDVETMRSSHVSDHHERSPQKPEPAPARKRTWRNWDWLSIGAFSAASIFGFIGVANNVRNTFWHNFTQGFGEIDSPFSPIRNKYTQMFKQTSADYKAGLLTGKEYRETQKQIANCYRTEVNTKLLKEFDIPTKGIEGWTVGTFKRMRELGLNGRINTTVGFATVAAISIGAVNVLRNSKRTLDKVEDKLEDVEVRSR
jgi:hypothetical protein